MVTLTSRGARSVEPLTVLLRKWENRRDRKALQPSPIATWKVLSFHIEFEDSDKHHEPFGKNPLGHVVITEERLIALITGPNRATDATAQVLFDFFGLYRSLSDAR